MDLMTICKPSTNHRIGKQLTFGQDGFRMMQTTEALPSSELDLPDQQENPVLKIAATGSSILLGIVVCAAAAGVIWY
jgi:hypothetical protein